MTWNSVLVPGCEDLCVLHSLDDVLLSHLGHTVSRAAAEWTAGADFTDVAGWHGVAMGDRSGATGIDYAGSNEAWAYQLQYPLQEVMRVWGPRFGSLRNPKANQKLRHPSLGYIEADLVHEGGIVELKLRTGDKKARRIARDQATRYGEAKKAGIGPGVEVWYLLDGVIDRLEN